jgi:hypothetical protein
MPIYSRGNVELFVSWIRVASYPVSLMFSMMRETGDEARIRAHMQAQL